MCMTPVSMRWQESGLCLAVGLGDVRGSARITDRECKVVFAQLIPHRVALFALYVEILRLENVYKLAIAMQRHVGQAKDRVSQPRSGRELA